MAKILGIGLDIVEISRVRRAAKKHGGRFLEKIFTKRERAACRARKKGCWASLAGRWAAKEAVYKAASPFLKGEAPHLEVEIHSLASGAPRVLLSGGIKRKLHKAGVARLEVSITHERETAAAVAILIGR